ncbi:hypothetical protein F5Y10DRAFT_283643 [Nemania abortiva]|nr:hypothetical protein F5Y10DRAFT_283643 [Nemania abortiva]
MRVIPLTDLLRMPRRPKSTATATSRWMTPVLTVGPRTYKFPLQFHLCLDGDALVLPYVDSSRVLAPPFRVLRRRDLTRPFEPFIAAVLIAHAQSSSSSSSKGGRDNPATESPITARLLFTHRDDKHRLIAAVSVTAIIKPNQADGNPGRGIKRASSPPGRVHHASPKRRRPPECPRDPLSILDPNGDHYAQHSSSSLSAPCT